MKCGPKAPFDYIADLQCPNPTTLCTRCEFDAALAGLIGAQSNNLLPFTPSTLLIADTRQQALALTTLERVQQWLSSGRFRPSLLIPRLSDKLSTHRHEKGPYRA